MLANGSYLKRRLRSLPHRRGVRYDGAAEVGLTPGGVSHDPNTAFILDPDGHRIELLSVPAQVAMDKAKRERVPA